MEKNICNYGEIRKDQPQFTSAKKKKNSGRDGNQIVFFFFGTIDQYIIERTDSQLSC